MTKKTFRAVVNFGASFAVVLLGALLLAAAASGQNLPPQNDESRGTTDAATTEKTEGKTAQTPSSIKVVFDEKNPGVLIIESNGEKIRVDATRKTVEQITAASTTPEKSIETGRQTESAKVQETTKQEQETEGSAFDFDEGDEPYDYRLVNIPTPRKVPKGSWNLGFTHRFTQPIHPIEDSGRNLFGFDSFSVSTFAVTYGITDKFYVTANRSPLRQRGLCRTIEIGFGYNWLAQDKDTPIGLTTYASIEGNGNFTEEYNYNLQMMLSSRLGKRVYLFFSPAVHINANGSRRFNPRPEQFFPPATIANSFQLPKHGASFGFGASVMITPNLLAPFDFTPRVGFKLGRVDAIFDNNFNVIGFQNVSHPSIGFGIQRNIGKHAFALTFSNTQTTTTSRYNSSNLALKPQRLVIGFNLFRRF